LLSLFKLSSERIMEMKISACVITKNEQENLPACLGSIASVVSEMIVVDTGSSDNTVNVAKELGAKVSYYQWDNNFSNAKNAAIAKATGDWIIFLDADEYLTEQTAEKLSMVLKLAEKEKADFIDALLANYDTGTKSMINSFNQTRIFRNSPFIRYEGAIHEKLVSKKQHSKKLDATKFLTIMHTGYSRSEMERKNKADRNIEILLKELENKPQDSLLCFYLSEAFLAKGHSKEALEYAEKSLDYRQNSKLDIYKKNYLNMLKCLIHEKHPAENINQIIQQAIDEYPDFPDFYFYHGALLEQRYRITDAILAYDKGLNLMEQGLGSQSGILHDFKEVLFAVGNLNIKVENYHEAVKLLIEVLKADRYYYKALDSLMRVLIKFEQTKDIIGLFAKIYDYQAPKDVLMLLKAASAAGEPNIVEFCLDKLAGEKVNLEQEAAQLKLLRRDFPSAAKDFQKLYLEKFDNVLAVKMISSAILSREEQLIRDVSQLVKPSLKRLADRELNQDILFLPEDRMDIAQVFEVAIKVQEFHFVKDRISLLRNNNLLWEVAETLYLYEEYAVALMCYEEFFATEMSGETFLDSIYSDILIKQAECLYRIYGVDGAKEASVKLEKALQLSPKDYRVYRVGILFSELLSDYGKLNQWVKTGIEYFPDSNYLKSKLQ